METIWPEKFPILKTRRLLLRGVSLDDAEGIYQCFSNHETMRYMGTPLDDPLSIAGIVEDYMKGFHEGYNLIWSLELLENREFLGTGGFEDFSFLDLKAETGFTLLKNHQGNGYMAEAMETITKFGFESIGLNRIEALVHPDNKGALRLVKKLGFGLEGTLRKSVFFNGNFHDQLVFAALREERS